jgi:hypothetical protein
MNGKAKWLDFQGVKVISGATRQMRLNSKPNGWHFTYTMGKNQGIHLVNKHSAGAQASANEHVPTARIQKHGFIADIIVSIKGQQQLYHYVIQPEYSNEIVHWGQELSFKRALESVEDFFEPYRDRRIA